MTDNVHRTTDELYRNGLRMRRDVLGAEYVDGSLSRASDFMSAFQDLVTTWCWGYGWTRPGLELKTRSIINLALLTALNRPAELRLHVRGALNNGVTPEEIREVLVQATIYCGIPAGLEAFKIADEILSEAKTDPSTSELQTVS